ncbi:MAG TPA: CoA-binding protein [Syntrophales bacterium]|nr:CoA-binding protein [Syntrophales bacterium]HPQ43836.1 CoA-binding protein [Syntrophales bacterium]
MESWKLRRIGEALYPESVAVVGISEAANNLGRQVIDILIKQGFPGKIFPVHPRISESHGLKVYPRLEDIGERVDLVVSAINAKFTAESIIESCARIGVKGIVCLAGGFKEVGDEGLNYEQRLRDVANANEIIIFGPNILGVANNDSRLYATFWSFKHGNPTGPVSLVSQSGGTACAMFSTMIDRNIGVNKWVCLGNRTNCEFSDMFYYLAQDEGTRVIAAFVEGIDDARGFMEAARVVSRKKPIVILKGARSRSMNTVAKGHTGTMGGEYKIFSDACRQNRILEVTNTQDMANVCKALALAPPPRGRRVAVVTHTAGPSILALDTLIDNRCPPAQVSQATLARVRKIIGEHMPIQLAPNPIDLTGSGLFVDIYPKCVEAVLEDDGVDMVMPLYARHPNFETSAKALAELRQRSSKPIIVSVINAREEMSEDEKIMQDAGIPVYQTPEEAALAASYLAQYYA